MKIFITLLLIAVLYCLGSALFYMISPKSNPEKMAKALAWRIGISLGIFALLIVGFFMGWITPHGI